MLTQILQLLADPFVISMIVLGAILGVATGAIPGLSGSTTAALLLPLTIFMDPVPSIAFLGAIYCASNYGGAITAILINTPGDPTNAATVLDGYPLTQKGKAGEALGMAAIASAIGGIFSVMVFIAAAPVLARIAYSFGAPEYFALGLFGLSMLSIVGGDAAIRNLIMGAFGVLLATVGVDLMSGVPRFTMGVPEFYEGIGLIPVLIGLFAISEMLVQSKIAIDQKLSKPPLADVTRLPSLADFRSCGKTIAGNSILGTIIGILPALGPTAAALIGYATTKRVASNKEEFGKGALKGVAAAETASNAAVGGSMIPTLSLGIPGSGTAAIIMAGLIAQGIRPGPQLFNQQPMLLYAVFFSMLITSLLFLVVGLFAAKGFARLARIPPYLLWPAVLIFSIIGSYSATYSMVGVWVMIAFGIIGFVMRRYGFSSAPLVMGLVLGGMVEESLQQSLLIFGGNPMLFFSRPIVVGLIVIVAVSAAIVWGSAVLQNQKNRINVA